MSTNDTSVAIVKVNRINPPDYPLTQQDQHELKTKRGFTDETIKACQFGSVKNQADLDTLGFDAKFEDLKSTILIPVPGTQDTSGKMLFQLHKLHLADVQPPLYQLPCKGSDTVVVAESPFKAVAANQLGYSAIGLNGIHSHVNRMGELRDAVKALKPGTVVVHLDTELRVDGPAPSLVMALAYARALETEDWDVVIVDLPDKYLVTDAEGRRKADLDGALSQGLTKAEWDQQIASGSTFWAHPAVVETKAEAIWTIEKENLFKDPEALKKLVGSQKAGIKSDVIKVIAEKAKNLAWDEDNHKYDDVQLEAFGGELQSLAKAIDLKLTGTALKKLLRPSTEGAEKVGAPTTKECGLTIRNDRLYRVGTGIADSAPMLVSNVVPTKIETGTLRYLRGPESAFHIVGLRGKAEPIRVIGSLFDAFGWETAGKGEITINSPAPFRQYIDHVISVDKIQTKDPALNSVMWIGTYKDSNGMKIVEGTAFPQEGEECPYHDLNLPDSTKDDVFNLMATLYGKSAGQAVASAGGTVACAVPVAGSGEEPVVDAVADSTVSEKGEGDVGLSFDGLDNLLPPKASDTEIWLLWVLGTFFKPAFGDAYPHLAVEGHKESGKTTIANEFVKRFGFCLFGAADQFSTWYRTRKSFSNTNLPIIVDEVNRLRGYSAESFVTVLNSAYNISYSTHGDRSKYFVLGAPAMILGQEWPYSDAALNAKTVILKLDSDAKQEAILNQLRNCPEKAPLKRWATHACAYANQQDMCTAVDAAVEEIRQSLTSCEYDRTTESSRTIWNYATILVTADAAIAFGLKFNRDEVKEKLAFMLCNHLGGDEDEEPRRMIGEQFLSDLVDELQSRSGRGSLTFKVTSTELLFNLPHALRTLQSKGHMYDISTSRSMADHLRQIGAEFDRRSLNKVQKRCCIIPNEVMERLKADVSGLCTQDDDDEEESDSKKKAKVKAA